MARNGPPNPFPADVPTDRIPWDQLPLHVQSKMPFAKPDIDILTGNGSANNTLFNQLLTNDGTGGFGEPSNVAEDGPKQSTRGIAVGDLDGDGDLDALIVNDVGSPRQTNQILINQGGLQEDAEGTFESVSWGVQNYSSTDVELGDLDGDGDLDAVHTSDWYSEPNYILINDGSAHFNISSVPGGPTISAGIELGDIDGDGDLDGLVANYQYDPLQVLINKGVDDGVWQGFSDPSNISNSGFSSRDTPLADLDGDGDLDALIANYGQHNQILINNGVEDEVWLGFSPPVALDDAAENTLSIAIGDLDGDGDMDAVVANVGSNEVLMNQGGDQGGLEGDFIASFIAGSPGFEATLADLDGDGDLDVALATSGGANANQVLFNDGIDETTGSIIFTPVDLEGIGLTQSIAVGDLDGDGSVPPADENGLPNINQDGLLPSMYVLPDDFLI